jgi:hypothetical protein
MLILGAAKEDLFFMQPVWVFLGLCRRPNAWIDPNNPLGASFSRS